MMAPTGPSLTLKRRIPKIVFQTGLRCIHFPSKRGVPLRTMLFCPSASYELKGPVASKSFS